MKKIILFAIIALTNCFSLSAQTIEITAAKRLVEPVYERNVKPENIVELKSVLKNTKGKPSYLWAISGSKGKDWDYEKGFSETNDKIKVTFNRLGNYTITVTVVFDKNSDNETEIETEVEDYITVRSVFPELAALYAEKPKPNYEKLTLRASDFIAKPKYANDPTPHLFLAKGLFGLVKEGNSEPEFEDALEESIASLQTAIELDKNGVLNDVEHQNFVNALEAYILKEYIEVHLDGKLPDLSEAIDLYKQTTLNPIAINFLDAYLKYKTKNVKAANLIWSTEIPKLMKYVRQEFDGKYTNVFTNELGNSVQLTETDVAVLKYGIMYSANLLFERDKNLNNACGILRAVDPWFQFEKDFRDLIEGDPFSSCVKR